MDDATQDWSRAKHDLSLQQRRSCMYIEGIGQAFWKGLSVLRILAKQVKKH